MMTPAMMTIIIVMIIIIVLIVIEIIVVVAGVIVSPRSPARPLIQEARHRGADSLALLAYASEGDNVPDAMHMASAAVQYLGMVPPEEAAAFRWELPGSWCNLYGPPVNEMMY